MQKLRYKCYTTPDPSNVGFVMNTVTLEQASVSVCLLFPDSVIRQRSILLATVCVNKLDT